MTVQKTTPDELVQPQGHALWNKATITKDTQKAKANYRKYGTGISETVLEMAALIEDMEPHQQVSIEFVNSTQKQKAAPVIRRACYLAGWYDQFPEDEWAGWQMWRSSSTTDSEGRVTLHIWKLETPIPSRTVTRK